MNEFVYLYRMGERPTGSPEQMQQRMQKWMAWMKDLSDRGHIKVALGFGSPHGRSGWLARSATGSALTEYHVEAAIASVHASAQRAEDTNWRQIVELYDTLMAIRPSPVVARNRAIAVAECEGP